VGYLRKFRKSLIIVGLVGLAVGTFLSYPTSKLIMCGDRIMQNYPPGYLGLTVSSKNWLLLVTLITIGGCVGYIVYTIIKKKGRLFR